MGRKKSRAKDRLKQAKQRPRGQRRVADTKQARQARAADQFDRAAVVLFGLAAEADDEVAGQDHAGDEVLRGPGQGQSPGSDVVGGDVVGDVEHGDRKSVV